MLKEAIPVRESHNNGGFMETAQELRGILAQESKDSKILDAMDVVNHVGHQLTFLSCSTEDPALGFTVIAIREYLEKAKRALSEAMGVEE